MCISSWMKYMSLNLNLLVLTLRLTLRKPTYFHNKQSRGGAHWAPPSISVVLYPICMKIYILVVFGLYFRNMSLKSNFTAWKLPELNGLNLAWKLYWIFRRRYLRNPWVYRNDTYIFGMCFSRRRIWVLLGVCTTIRSKFENFACSKKA